MAGRHPRPVRPVTGGAGAGWVSWSLPAPHVPRKAGNSCPSPCVPGLSHPPPAIKPHLQATLPCCPGFFQFHPPGPSSLSAEIGACLQLTPSLSAVASTHRSGLRTIEDTRAKGITPACRHRQRVPSAGPMAQRLVSGSLLCRLPRHCNSPQLGTAQLFTGATLSWLCAETALPHLSPGPPRASPGVTELESGSAAQAPSQHPGSLHRFSAPPSRIDPQPGWEPEGQSPSHFVPGSIPEPSTCPPYLSVCFINTG